MSREATLEPDEEGAHLHGAEINGGLGRETGIAQRQAPPFAVELGRPELVPGEVHEIPLSAAEDVAEYLNVPVQMVEVHPTHERLEVGVVHLNEVR